MNAQQTGSEHGSEQSYSERLGVPLRWWVQSVMFVTAFWLALIVAVPERGAWVIAGLLLLIVAGALLTYGSARIQLAAGTLRVGRARIGVEHLGTVSALDTAETRATAGMHADARAYLVLRPYLKQSVRVEITDPADPAPYWLISTRHPERLAGALSAVASPERPIT